MSDETELTRIAQRLEELAGMLRDPSLEDDRAAALAGEAAELAADAASALDRELREAAAQERPAGQEELL